MNHRISIVIPFYNEAENLGKFLEKLFMTVTSIPERFELILIDDGSNDDTWHIITQFIDKNIPAIGLRFSRHFGKEAALMAGIESASGDAVITMDGDLQHPPEIIQEMITKWKDEKYDVVEAVKIQRGKESIITKLQARLFYLLFRFTTGHAINGSSDFKLMNRKVVDEFLRFKENGLFYRGLSVWLGFRRYQIPFSVPQIYPKKNSAWTLPHLLRLALTALTSFSSLPLYLVVFMGIAFSIFAIVLGADALYLKFSGRAVSGFTTVITLILFSGGSIMISLGIIGAYIARIFEEVKRRPRYIVSQSARSLESNPELSH